MYATIIDEEENSIVNGGHRIVTYLWPVHGADSSLLGYTSKLKSAYSLICYVLSQAVVLDRVGVTGDI